MNPYLSQRIDILSKQIMTKGICIFISIINYCIFEKYSMRIKGLMPNGQLEIK